MGISKLMEEGEVASRLVPVIVGGTFLSYSYVREFNRAYGIRRCIVVLSDEIKMLTSSRFADCRIIPDAGDSERMVSALLGIASELKAQDASVVPMALGCDDRHALTFAEFSETLEKAGYVVPHNDFAMMKEISLKERFYEICEKLGIPHPKSRYFSCGADGPASIPVEDFTYPLYAKPSDTTLFQNADVANKRKAYEIDTPEEMARVWRELRESSYDGIFVIQDLIPGGDENIRSLTTFSDEHGRLLAASGGRVVLQDHSPLAIGNPLCIICEHDPEIIDCAKAFLKHVRYQGFGNFDIKYNPDTGQCMFLEINIRAGRNTYYMSLGGINFVTLLVDRYVLGNSIPRTEAYDPFAYCCVPKYVLRKSIYDRELLDRTLDLLKKTKDPYPLHYSPDTAAHEVWSKIMYLNQIRKFKRFYWDTGGKQLK